MQRANRGFWHYSMAGNLVCSDSAQVDPESKLRRIDCTHGLLLGILMSGLFVLARRAGLTARWSFFSCLVALLFMGTNRFSYFSYYSLAPSSTSLLMYWLWAATFFFRRNRQAIFAGVGTALLCFPILWVNHGQEAVFLGFLVVVWLLLNASCFVLSRWNSRSGECQSVQGRRWHWHPLFMKSIFFSILFALLFILPQFEFFKDFAADFFVRDLWVKNQGAVVSWHGLHLWGKVWSFRVNDTLGAIGIVMAALVFMFFWPRLIRIRMEKKIRIYVLALLPFLGYGIPLFHFIWLSNVRGSEYYRLCYSSMFWLLFAAILQGVEGRLLLGFSKIKKRMMNNAELVKSQKRILYGRKKQQVATFPPSVSRHFTTSIMLVSGIDKKRVRVIYFICCCTIVVLLSGVRSGPIYGKLDFLSLNSRPWWPQWQPMISSVLQYGDQPVFSDMMTSTVLRAVFDQKTVMFRFDRRYALIDIEQLLAMNTERLLPVGALMLLLRSHFDLQADGVWKSDVKGVSVVQMMMKNAEASAEKRAKGEHEYPYRCLINLDGFTASWVPTETGHWSWRWSEPSLLYEFKGVRGKELEPLLRDDSPENCMVYF